MGEKKSLAKGGQGFNLELCNKANPKIVGSFELGTLIGEKTQFFFVFIVVISDSDSSPFIFLSGIVLQWVNFAVALQSIERWRLG